MPTERPMSPLPLYGSGAVIGELSRSALADNIFLV